MSLAKDAPDPRHRANAVIGIASLSRVIEDSGTLTSPLVPWNTCGAYMAATLGVATLAYLSFVFFNLINPIISICET